MTRYFPVSILLALFLGAALAAPLQAEIIIYDGTNPALLRPSPFGAADSLFPNAPSNNEVRFLGGSIAGVVYGGTLSNSSAPVSGNSVLMTGGSVGNSILGASTRSASSSATAIGNSATLTGGNITNSMAGAHVETNTVSNSGTAKGNFVNMNGGSVGTDVYGASVTSSGLGLGTGNSATVSGGSVGMSVSGALVVGDLAATATGNSVVISGGTLFGLAGYVSGAAARSFSGSATATGNFVTITGGNISLHVYGGSAGGSTTSTATDNTVTLSGRPTFDPSAGQIYGGYTSGGATRDPFSRNRLNVWNYAGSAVTGVSNFEFFNFVVPASATASASPALEVTGTLSLANAGNTKQSTIEAVNFAGGGPVLQQGESVTLIQAGSISGTLANNGQNITGRKGVALLHEMRIQQSANSITATMLGTKANPQMKAFSEGFLGATILTNQGSDLVANQGISNAVAATRADLQAGEASGLRGFGAISAGKSRYNTGSHVDTSGFSLLTGLAWRQNLTPGHLTLGAFFEAGGGSYNTYNSFNSTASVDGNGNTRYLGGGLLARMDFLHTETGHFYLEGSARTGGLFNHYSTDDLVGVTGKNEELSYDTSSPYYGLHGGGGYVWNIADALTFDVYGKYFWTRQEGASITLGTGDKVEFDTADSNRLRFGSRASYTANNYLTPYIGVAWEHEFAGKAEATTYGYTVSSPSLRGDTGIGEVGLSLRPSQTVPFTLDLGIQGYVGKREGVAGSLQATWEF